GRRRLAVAVAVIADHRAVRGALRVRLPATLDPDVTTAAALPATLFPALASALALPVTVAPFPATAAALPATLDEQEAGADLDDGRARRRRFLLDLDVRDGRRRAGNPTLCTDHAACG